MVDFQSRDTRRGPPLDDEEDAADDGSAGADEETTADESSVAGDEVAEDDPVATADPEAEAPAADQRDDDTGDPLAAAPDDEGATDSDETAGPDPDGADPAVDEPAGPASEEGAPAADEVSETATEADDGPASADPLAGSRDQPSPPEPTAADSQPSAADPLAESESQSPPADATAGDDTSDPAAPATAIDVAVVTVGGEGTERVERAVSDTFESAGHAITVRERLRGEYDTLQQVVGRLVDRADVDAVVTAGGIGVASDEVTIEAVHPLFEKALPGFGEAFRALLFEEIGAGIVAVRSTAGVTDGTLVFCLPGDAAAARLAVEEILVTEAPELVDHLR